MALRVEGAPVAEGGVARGAGFKGGWGKGGRREMKKIGGQFRGNLRGVRWMQVIMIDREGERVGHMLTYSMTFRSSFLSN